MNERPLPHADELARHTAEAPAATTTAAVLGQPVTITFESGRTASLTLRAFKVREFNDLIPLLGQESVLIERGLGVPKGSLTDGDDPIAPESYGQLAEEFGRLNRPFFDFCSRQTRLLNQVQGKTMERALAAAIGTHLSNSAAGSSGSPSPRG